MLKREDKFYKLAMPEKYKPAIKKAKWALALLGLVSSLIIFPSILYSFAFSLFLLAIGAFVERVIFHYSPLYIQPLPNFKIENEKWLGMTYGYTASPDMSVVIPLIGLFFSEEAYAKKVYDLLLEWNYGEHIDLDNNIQASLILRGDKEYTFFIYPNAERETAKRFFEQTEAERKKTSLTDLQIKEFLQLVMGKGCKISDKNRFDEFIELFKEKKNFFLQLLVMKNGKPEEIPGVGNFKKLHLKIKREEELDRKDIEYPMLKVFND